MVLFSIPIYAFSEDFFYNKIDCIKEEYIFNHSNNNTIPPRNYFDLTHKDKMLYENYCIGFLKVILNNDITYEIYLMQGKNGPYYSRIFSSKKHYMSKDRIEGLHRIIFHLSNKEISRCIKKDVLLIKQMEEYNKLYFDLDTFNLLVDNLDYLSIIKRLRKNEQQ